MPKTLRFPHFRTVAGAFLALACCLSAPAHAGDSGAAAPAGGKTSLKAGFVYIGPVGDYGWTHQHNEGRLALQKALGDQVKTAFVDEVPETPAAEKVIEQFVRQGYDIVFTTSFGYMDSVAAVAARNPGTRFEHAGGNRQMPNLAVYDGRFYEGRVVTGTIAGLMTKSNVIGYVAAFPIPEVIQGIDAFTLAARKVNPKVQVRLTWVNSWYNPAKDREAALALVAQGADILVQHTDSPAVVQVAEEKGVYTFGQSTDMARFAPKMQLAAIEDDWSGYYISRAKAILDGTWKSDNTWGGLAEGMVRVVNYNSSLPPAVLEKAKAVETEVKARTLNAFAGPVRDQAGTERVKAGEVLDDRQLLSLDWLVEGVQGIVPK